MIRRHTTPGRLEVITGCMHAGKSSELLRRVRRSLIAKERVQVFKSCLDDRYTGGVQCVTTHDGTTLATTPVRTAAELDAAIHPETEVVAVDEVQFFDPAIVAVLTAHARAGRRVIASGIDVDFRGEVFGPMGQLMVGAEAVEKLTAVCVCCGADAIYNQRIVDGMLAPYDAPTVLVGAAESYQARCRRCFVPPRPSSAP